MSEIIAADVKVVTSDGKDVINRCFAVVISANHAPYDQLVDGKFGHPTTEHSVRHQRL